LSEERGFSVEIAQEESFRFSVDFGLEGMAPFYMDEPEPVGANTGPNASKVLAAAMANCLAASLMFCLQKSRVEIEDMKATAKGVLRRNEDRRWRIVEINVDLYPKVPEDKGKQLERCKDIFDDFCIVSKSIEQGIPVNIKVHK
jgi:organic hydroperoxide reductase OsmC/OhrA